MSELTAPLVEVPAEVPDPEVDAGVRDLVGEAPPALRRFAAALLAQARDDVRRLGWGSGALGSGLSNQLRNQGVEGARGGGA